MHTLWVLIGVVGFALQPLGLTAGELRDGSDSAQTVIAVLPETAVPVDAPGGSEDGAARRVGVDPSRSQALARALLLVMTGSSSSRPFPLIPQ